MFSGTNVPVCCENISILCHLIHGDSAARVFADEMQCCGDSAVSKGYCICWLSNRNTQPFEPFIGLKRLSPFISCVSISAARKPPLWAFGITLEGRGEQMRHSSSLLSTPNTAASSGTASPAIEQVFSMCCDRISLHAITAKGGVNSLSQAVMHSCSHDRAAGPHHGEL